MRLPQLRGSVEEEIEALLLRQPPDADDQARLVGQAEALRPRRERLDPVSHDPNPLLRNAPVHVAPRCLAGDADHPVELPLHGPVPRALVRSRDDVR